MLTSLGLESRIEICDGAEETDPVDGLEEGTEAADDKICTVTRH